MNNFEYRFRLGLVQLQVQNSRLTDSGITAEIIALDGPYGNAITNIDAADFRKLGYTVGDLVKLKIGEREFTIPFKKTFSDVPINQPLLYVDSRGHMAFAINQGNFAGTYLVRPPVAITIPSKR